jgi:hypothetical protein
MDEVYEAPEIIYEGELEVQAGTDPIPGKPGRDDPWEAPQR